MDLKKYISGFDGLTIHLVGPFFKETELLEEPIIYVDGGARFRKDLKGFSVGDGDSSTGKLDQTLNKEKDFSDLAFALGCIPNIFSIIQLHGFLGFRKDHEIMNLAEVHSLLSKVNQPTQAYFDKSIIAFSKGEWSLHIQGVFSLFAFAPVELKLSGACDYKLEEIRTLKALSSHGLSNKGHGAIEIHCTAPIFIFFNESKPLR